MVWDKWNADGWIQEKSKGERQNVLLFRKSNFSPIWVCACLRACLCVRVVSLCVCFVCELTSRQISFTTTTITVCYTQQENRHINVSRKPLQPLKRNLETRSMHAIHVLPSSLNRSRVVDFLHSCTTPLKTLTNCFVITTSKYMKRDV